MTKRGLCLAPSAALLLTVALARPADSMIQTGRSAPDTVVYITGSSTGSGIRIGPEPALGTRPDIIRAVRFAASVRDFNLAVTIDPEQAAYWLVLDLNELVSPERHTWTLIDAATGIVLEQGTRSLLQNAMSDAVEAIVGRAQGGSPGLGS